MEKNHRKHYSLTIVHFHMGLYPVKFCGRVLVVQPCAEALHAYFCLGRKTWIMYAPAVIH